jgi:MFS family permease
VLFVGDDTNYVTGILPGLILTGIGSTASVATCTGAIMSRIPPPYYSMSGAARTTIFQLGLAVGIAIAVAIADAGDHLTGAPFHTIWALAAICSLVAAALMAALFPSKARISN